MFKSSFRHALYSWANTIVCQMEFQWWGHEGEQAKCLYNHRTSSGEDGVQRNKWNINNTDGPERGPASRENPIIRRQGKPPWGGDFWAFRKMKWRWVREIWVRTEARLFQPKRKADAKARRWECDLIPQKVLGWTEDEVFVLLSSPAGCERSRVVEGGSALSRWNLRSCHFPPLLLNLCYSVSP